MFIFVKYLKKLNFAAFAFPPKVFLHNFRETVDIGAMGNPCKKVKFKKKIAPFVC
jgi:hypothetical protein